MAPILGAVGRSSLPFVLAGILTSAVVCGLFWPLPLHLQTHAAAGYFHDGHVWAFDQIGRMVEGELPFYTRTDQTGFPKRPEARFIAWSAALAVVPLRPWLGPLGAYNVSMLGSLGVGAALAGLWIHRVAGGSRWAAALLGVTFGLSPFALGCLASGQTCKAQIWILPAALLLLGCTLEAKGWRGRVLGLLGFAAVIGLGGLSEPTHVLLLPFILPLQALSSVWRGRADGAGATLGRVGLSVVAAALAAGVLDPVRWYYDIDSAFSAFRPADRNLDAATRLLAIAEPLQLWAPPTRIVDPGLETLHLPWLGRVMLVTAALGLLRGGPGRWLGLGLVGVGVSLALGEVLVMDGEVVLVDGARLRLPAWWLAEWAYPLAQSGQYYRAVVVASLGLPLLVAAGLSRLKPALAVVLAVSISAAAVAEVVRGTEALWPRPVSRVNGLSLMAEMAADPAPGAVLEVPVEATFLVGQRAMLSAAVHGRPTSAMPRITRIQDLDVTRGLNEVLELLPGLGPDEARGRLRRIGFRYVVWRPGPAGNGVSPETLIPVLGPPREVEGVRVWVVEDR